MGAVQLPEFGLESVLEGTGEFRPKQPLSQLVEDTRLDALLPDRDPVVAGPFFASRQPNRRTPTLMQVLPQRRRPSARSEDASRAGPCCRGSTRRPRCYPSTTFDAIVPILSLLSKAEPAEREVRCIACHMKAVRFPACKDISGVDFTSGEINASTARQVHRREVPDGARNVVLINGQETGKTHVATALGIQAIEHRRRKVRFFSSIELVNAIEQEKTKGKDGHLAESLTPEP